MLPDGAKAQPADWTVFFLCQTPFDFKPVLTLDNDDGTGTEYEVVQMLCVLDLVWTKLEKTVRR